MLYYAVALFVSALIAALFGFTDIAVGATGIARMLCAALLAGAAAAALAGSVGRGVGR